MTKSNNSAEAKLKKEYLHLIKLELEKQKRGDIKAFADLAMKKEQVAQQLQALRRNL